MFLSGADERMKHNPTLYNDALSKTPNKKVKGEILVDIRRTFPENSNFADTDAPDSKIDSLYRVLVAFATEFPDVGYCQGFNYIVAVLLLVLQGEPNQVEEMSFWLMDALVNHILPLYYSDDMMSIRVDCMVFVELLKQKERDIYSVIQKSDVDCTLLATRWFICLFADVLPIETTLRVFDCLFYEGDKILFRASLALVKLHYNQLIQCTDFPTLLTVFRNMTNDRQTLWCHQFLTTMFKSPGRLSRSLITRLRKQCSLTLVEQKQ